MSLYDRIGQTARVTLYTREGTVLGTIEGRVADVASAVPVGTDANTGEPVTKDLLLLVDIQTPNGEVYTNSAGDEGEGWFALHDASFGPTTFFAN